jgi:hypothetical protein
VVELRLMKWQSDKSAKFRVAKINQDSGAFGNYWSNPMQISGNPSAYFRLLRIRINAPFAPNWTSNSKTKKSR